MLKYWKAASVVILTVANGMVTTAWIRPLVESAATLGLGNVYFVVMGPIAVPGLLAIETVQVGRHWSLAYCVTLTIVYMPIGLLLARLFAWPKATAS